MPKIKPLRKKHRFIRWIKKVLGIKSPSIGDWKDIDEMHLMKDENIHQCIMQGMSKEQPTEKKFSREEVMFELEKLIRWTEQTIVLRGRQSGKGCEFEVSLLLLLMRTLELLNEDANKVPKLIITKKNKN